MEEEIQYLKRELKDAHEDLEKAGTFGKQLLEQNTILNNKVDQLSQAKYALEFKIKNLTITESALQQDNTNLKTYLDETQAELNIFKSQNSALQLKITNLEIDKENIFSQLENESREKLDILDKVKLLEIQVGQLQDQLKCSQQPPLDLEEIDTLRSNYNNLFIVKQNLEMRLSEQKELVERHKLEKEKLQVMVYNTEEENKNRDAEISQFTQTIQKCKEIEDELRGEIEIMKMEQYDPKKRGNSLFAEVDDYRQQVEHQFLSLKNEYAQLREKYDFATGQIKMLKHQAIILLSMTQRTIDSKYLQYLEETIKSSKLQNEELNLKLRELHQRREQINANENGVTLGLIEYQLDSLRKQYDSLLLKNSSQTDQLFDCQKKLYQAETKCSQYRNLALELHFKLDEMVPNFNLTTSEMKMSQLDLLDKESIREYAKKKAKRQAAESQSLINLTNIQNEYLEHRRLCENKPTEKKQPPNDNIKLQAAENQSLLSLNNIKSEHLEDRKPLENKQTEKPQFSKDTAKLHATANQSQLILNNIQSDHLGDGKLGEGNPTEKPLKDITKLPSLMEELNEMTIAATKKEILKESGNKKCISISEKVEILGESGTSQPLKDEEGRTEKKVTTGRKVTAPTYTVSSAPQACAQQ